MNDRLKRLSAPPRSVQATWHLAEADAATVIAVADCLIPRHGDDAGASEQPQLIENVEGAIAARRDDVDVLMQVLERLRVIPRENLLTTLRSMSDDGESSFGVLSSVIAGGYLMMPSVRDHIGYPGHGRHRVDIEKTVDQLTSGILSSVQERGHTFRRPPEEDT